MSDTTPPVGSLRATIGLFRALPGRIWSSIFRHGAPNDPRNRALVVLSNVFLHIHPVHVHRNTLRPGFTLGLGVITMVLFVILCVTGVILMIFYVPTTDEAYIRIKDLTFTVPAGQLIRNLHRWTAHGMVVAVMAHMARVFYTASYRAPREFNWVIGIMLLIVTLAFSFTGYLLPWDQLAYWAIVIGTNIAGSFREVTDSFGVTAWFDLGGMIRRLLLGGHEIGNDALNRFYVVHVISLPIATLVLLAIHFWRIRKDGGLSRPDEEPGPPLGVTPEEMGTRRSYGLMALLKGKPTSSPERIPDDHVNSWPTVFLWEATLFMAVLALFLLLSLAVDAPLKELANPAVPENPAKAPWYFLGTQELISYSAFAGGILVPTLAIVGLMLIPYLDVERSGVGRWVHGQDSRRELIFSAIYAAVVIVGIEAIAINFGWLREWFADIPQLVITLFNPGTLMVLAFAARSAYVVRRTGSTRAGAVSTFTMFIVGFIILTIIGVYFRGPNWDFYWSQADWPGVHHP